MSTSTVQVPEPTEVQSSPTPPWHHFSIERFEKIAKACVVVIAVLYAIGLLATNKYLMRYGISDFGALRPKYIFTGAWLSWLICVSLLPIGTFAAIKRYVTTRWPIVYGGTLVALLANISLFGLTASTFGLDPDKSKTWSSYGLLMVFCSPSVLLLAFLYRRANETHGIILRSVSAILSVFVSIGILELATDKFYGSIPEALGGGRPITATLIFNTQGVIVWQQAGMPIAVKTAMNSEKIKIIYQDDHNLYVEGSYHDQQQTKTKLVIVNHGLVDLILPEPEQ